MAEITAIKPVIKNPARATIRVDGKAVGTLPHSRVVELGLQVGQTWTSEDQRLLDGAVAYDKAWADAMRPLNRRALSRKQLRDKLREKGHDETVAERVIERLEELGVVDDEAFGRSLIRQTMLRKAAGPHLLRTKLMQKGLERSLIDRLVSEACEDSGEQADAARELVEKKLRSIAMQKLDPADQKRRLWGMLARRGFNGDTIREALTCIGQTDDFYAE